MSGGNTGDRRQLVAAELKRVRQAARLSQEQMAKRLGMDYAPGGRRVSTGRAAVSAWERGRRVPPQHYLQGYVALGGDPAVLALPPESPPREGQAEPEAAASAEESELPTPAPRRRARRRWLASGAAVLLAAGGGFLASTFQGDAQRGPVPTWTETTGTPAHTWADATQLTGAGQPLGPRQSVQVLCRVRGYVVQDGDPWWYRLASTPWDGHFYATSDAFYNNGATSGPVDTGVVVDEQVPVCPGG